MSRYGSLCSRGRSASFAVQIALVNPERPERGSHAEAWEKGEKGMKYRVHRLKVEKNTVQEELEQFLNQLQGKVLAVLPYVTPTFQGMGATAKVDFLLIVEQVREPS